LVMDNCDASSGWSCAVLYNLAAILEEFCARHAQEIDLDASIDALRGH